MSRFERARTSLRTWQKTTFRWSLRSRDGSSHGRFRLMVGIGAFSAAALASGLVAVPLAQAGGTWSGAVEVPGAATLNTGGNGAINAISCSSAGNCSAIGTYGDTANGTQAFVVDETHGTWGSAQEIPGYGALNAGDNAEILQSHVVHLVIAVRVVATPTPRRIRRPSSSTKRMARGEVRCRFPASPRLARWA